MISIAVPRRVEPFLPRKMIDQLVLQESGARTFPVMRGRHARGSAIWGCTGGEKTIFMRTRRAA